jgi:hypothetical protein
MSLKYETHVANYGDLKSIVYRRYGQQHRIDAPTRLWDDGDNIWYQYGSLHRVGGPARCVNSRKVLEFYYRGVEYVLNVPNTRYPPSGWL